MTCRVTPTRPRFARPPSPFGGGIAVSGQAEFTLQKSQSSTVKITVVENSRMKFAYYPGCSARSTCAELNEATHRVARRLGLDLVQLDSATCTGARELRAIDPLGFFTLNVRILALAEREGLPLMTICNTCTLNVLDAHAAFVGDPELAGEVDGRLAVEGLCYSGRTRISHFLWVL